MMSRAHAKARDAASNELDAGHAPRVSPSWQDKPGVGLHV
jgi:hypothetical protein